VRKKLGLIGILAVAVFPLFAGPVSAADNGQKVITVVLRYDDFSGISPTDFEVKMIKTL
jgi:hypothetical protein